ncbi:MAG: BC1872 family protein [Desulfonatronovibrionaceae bacterium]
MQGKDLSAEVSELFQLPEKNYSQEIQTALELAEHLQKKGYGFRLKDMCPKDIESNLWRAEFICPDEVTVSEDNESAARAVCLAAVRAFQLQ